MSGEAMIGDVHEAIEELYKPQRRIMRWALGAGVLMAAGLLSMKYDLYRSTHELRQETVRAAAAVRNANTAADSANSAAARLKGTSFRIVQPCYTRGDGVYKVDGC